MTPGRTSSPDASTTSCAAPTNGSRSASTVSIRPPLIATSACREPDAVTTVPPRISESVICKRRAWRRRPLAPGSGAFDDRDRLGAFPQAAPPDLAQPILPPVVRDDRREVVARELAHLRRAGAGAVREEDLALADAARIDRDLARRRVRRVVLIVESGAEVAERDPRRLAAPAAVDQL